MFLAHCLRSGTLRIDIRVRHGMVAIDTFTTWELDMIAGLLAMWLVSADTTMRIAPPPVDTMTAREVVAVDAPSLSQGPSSDSLRVRVVSVALRTDVTDPSLRLAWQQPDTTIKKKKRVLVEYSEWYGRRLAIHRTLTWAMIPLFATSYYTGERLARDGRVGSPYWVRAAHPYAATGASGTTT